MSIRKHWGKFVLGLAASFWAGCNETTEPEYIQGGENGCTDEQNMGCGGAIALYGVAPNFDISSGSISGDCPDGNCAASSSSMDESSSSVNSEYPYVLHSDPTVHCKDSTHTYMVACPSSRKKAAEEDLQQAAPLYGIVTPVCRDHQATDNYFVCNNGNVLSGTLYMKVDDVIYTREEYQQLFGNSSSDEQ